MVDRGVQDTRQIGGRRHRDAAAIAARQKVRDGPVRSRQVLMGDAFDVGRGTCSKRSRCTKKAASLP